MESQTTKSKRGRKKAEVTELKEIIARIPTEHIAPIIELIKEYCINCDLQQCVDPDTEKNELKALCAERKLNYDNIDTMSITAVKAAIKSITKADLHPSNTKQLKKKVLAAVQKIEPIPSDE